MMNSRLTRSLVLAAPAIALFAVTASAQTPVLYFNFNEPVGSTTFADGNLDGGTAFDAAYQGAGTPSYGQGVLQGAWRGTGAADDYFLTSEVADLTGFLDISISAWVNPSGTAGYDGIFNTRSAQTSLGNATNPSSGNWGLAHEGTHIDARIQTSATGSNGTDSPDDSLPAGEWTHVAFTYNSFIGETKIYLNGAESTTKTGLPVDIEWFSGGQWAIGDDLCCGGREFNGLLDDVALYDTLLSASDITSIYNNGLAGIAIDGSVNPLAGDVDGNGVVQAFIPGPNNDDYDIILANFLDDVSGSGDTRPMGDLTNDGVVNLADFRAFKDAFSGGATGATVPEPSSFACVLAAIAAGFYGFRRRVAVAAPAAALLVVAAAAPAEAQVVATVNQTTGQVTVANPGATEIRFDGYSFQSANALLNPAGWSSFEVNQSAAHPGWDRFAPENATQLGEQLLTAGVSEVVPGPGSPINFGSVFSPAAVSAAQLNAGLGVEVRDVVFQYREPGVLGGTTGVVEYIGETVTNNLVVKIASNGTAVLENESPFALEIDGFALTSASGALNGSWGGSPDLTLSNSAWQLGSTSPTGLGQVSLTSSETLDAAVVGVVQAGGRLNLGSIFTPGSANDIEFRFLRVGEDDGEGFVGVVEYASSLVRFEGDYNNDGSVDAADYTVWRDNNGTMNILPNDPTPGVVDQSDYDLWVANYGSSAATAEASAVPEPAGLLAALVGVAAAVAGRRR